MPVMRLCRRNHSKQDRCVRAVAGDTVADAAAAALRLRWRIVVDCRPTHQQ